MSNSFRIFLAAAIVTVCFVSCKSNLPEGAISGKIEGAEGKTISLERFINNRSVKTDSTVAGDGGSFVLIPQQKLDLNFYRILIGNDDFATLITDSTESPEIKGDLKDFEKTMRVTCSQESENLRDLELKLEPFDSKELEIKSKFGTAASQEEKAMLNQEMINNRKARTEFVKSWLETHSASPAALLAIQHLEPRTDMEIFNKVFTDLDGSFGHTLLYKGIKQQVQMFMAKEKGTTQGQPPVSSSVTPGKPAPEIALADPSGKVRKLSDLKGKTVLIDFWASWCGPCRRENPNVVAAYNKYNKDGFEVFSVSLDKAKEPWLDAIKKDGLIWTNHVSDLKWWDSQAAKTYNVRSIPFTVLVDKDGNIIGHNFRGPMLEEKLQAIYGH